MSLRLWDARLLTELDATDVIITVAAPDREAAWEAANTVAAHAEQPLAVQSVTRHRPLIVSKNRISQVQVLVDRLRRTIRDGETGHALELAQDLAGRLDAIAHDQQATIEHRARQKGAA